MDILEKTISKISPWQTAFAPKTFLFLFYGEKNEPGKKKSANCSGFKFSKKKINQKKGEAKTFPIFQKRNYLIPGFDGP